MSILPFALGAISVGVVVWVARSMSISAAQVKNVEARRSADRMVREQIGQTPWPDGFQSAWMARYPRRSWADFEQASEAFKDYLCVVAISQLPTALPSDAADSVWHLLLENPETYVDFCEAAAGRYVPHIEKADFDTPMMPALAMTWALSCHLEGINPHHPTRLPRLFATDRTMNWGDGYHYALVNGRVVHQRTGNPNEHVHNWAPWLIAGLSFTAAGYAWGAQRPVPGAQAAGTGSSSSGDGGSGMISWNTWSDSTPATASSSDSGHGGHDAGGSSCGGGDSGGGGGDSGGSSCGSSCSSCGS